MNKEKIILDKEMGRDQGNTSLHRSFISKENRSGFLKTTGLFPKQGLSQSDDCFI